MRVSYSCIRSVWSLLSKRIVMAAGLLILPLTSKIEKAASAEPVPVKAPVPAKEAESAIGTDPRTARLRRFFTNLHCPVLSMAEDFVHAADDNQLDWRLLPSISVVESGGGKEYRNNNIFGWNNGSQPFPSIRAGLNLVAFKLGQSPLYRNQNLFGKLRLYNPDSSYTYKVIEVMNRISPVADVTSAERLVRRQDEYVYATVGD